MIRRGDERGQFGAGVLRSDPVCNTPRTQKVSNAVNSTTLKFCEQNFLTRWLTAGAMARLFECQTDAHFSLLIAETDSMSQAQSDEEIQG